jgi:N6-adenosine-specific RNA methylase IME4
MEIDPKALALLPFELRAEISENLYRKDWTPSELESIRRRCADALAHEARKRQASAGPATGRGAKTGSRTDSQTDPGRTTDKVGAFFGISGRKVEQIAAVVAAAEREPEKYGRLVEDMDRTGQVGGVYKRLVVAQKAEAIAAEPPPLPTGPFRTIVADPPWVYERDADASHRGACPYPTLTVPEICAMPVADLAAEDAVLWLWVTNPNMRRAFEVLDAWGFQERTILTWVKPHFGCGHWLRGQTEHCIMAVRGRPIVTLSNQATVLHVPVPERQHSRKPEEFYRLVESLCPGSKLELFCRHPRPGWAAHGDETGAAA